MKGPETEKSHIRRFRSGSRASFFETYMRGTGLDIGHGHGKDPVLPSAIGIESSYPGYDGKILPFQDSSQDYVYSSHCLEHLKYPVSAIREWYRVIKVGGYLVITVPHRDLYEKKKERPSLWNPGHKRFYLPSLLLQEIEEALPPNTYRIRYLQDCDEGYDYSIPPDTHAGGEYQIECVVQKIARPSWDVL